MLVCIILGIKGVTDQGHEVTMEDVVWKGPVHRAMTTMTNTTHLQTS